MIFGGGQFFSGCEVEGACALLPVGAGAGEGEGFDAVALAAGAGSQVGSGATFFLCWGFLTPAAEVFFSVVFEAGWVEGGLVESGPDWVEGDCWALVALASGFDCGEDCATNGASAEVQEKKSRMAAARVMRGPEE
jgi:hypothetical protein